MATINDILNTMDYGPAPESQKEAQAWLDQQGRKFGLFIDNAWSEPGELFASTNPADGKQLAELTQATADDVNRAVEAARRAQPAWQGLGGHGRAKVLYAIARLMQKHARLFAVLETLDNGKTIRETRDADLPLVARHFYYHAGWAQLQDEEFAGHRPVGVVGQIVHRRVQACRIHAADGHAVRAHLRPGRRAGRCRQHCHGRRPGGRSHRQA
jgi:aldehyde dehydrogenase (NAD+)